MFSRRLAAKRENVARRKIRMLSEKSQLVIGEKTWSREDLHNRLKF